MTPKYNRVMLVSGAQVVPSPPPGAAFLAGVCESIDVDYEILDLNIFIYQQLGEKLWKDLYEYTSILKLDYENLKEKFNYVTTTIEKAVDVIELYQPDLIAISILSFHQHQWCTLLLKEIKKRLNVDTIVGGPGVGNSSTRQTFGRKLVDNNLVDYYVVGEGDYVFKDFLLNKNKAKYVNSKKSLMLSELTVPQIDDLNVDIFPSYKKIDFEIYNSIPMSQKFITVTGSRGCVRRCTFCDVGAIWKKFRYRSGKHIADELVNHYHTTKITDFFFSDSLINGSLKQLTDFTQELIKLREEQKLPKFTYGGQWIVRPTIHHKESFYKLLQESGCRYLECGVESGSNSVRDHMGKKFSNDDIDYHFKMSSKFGIENLMYIFTGYPTETKKDFQDTIDLLTRLQKYRINGTLNHVSPGKIYALLEGTPIWNMQDQLKIQQLSSESKGDYDLNVNNWYSLLNPELDIKERVKRWALLTKHKLKKYYSTNTLNIEHHIIELELNKKAYNLLKNKEETK